MPEIDTIALAKEFLSAYTTGAPVAVPPSARFETFDLNSAYAVEAEFARLRSQSGRQVVGRKVGYASKAVWRVLKLETLVWAHMYDDTVHLWDVATGEEVLTLKAHTHEVVSLAFSPDGNQLASASNMGPAKIWDASPSVPDKWKHPISSPRPLKDG